VIKVSLFIQLRRRAHCFSYDPEPSHPSNVVSDDLQERRRPWAEAGLFVQSLPPPISHAKLSLWNSHLQPAGTRKTKQEASGPLIYPLRAFSDHHWRAHQPRRTKFPGPKNQLQRSQREIPLLAIVSLSGTVVLVLGAHVLLAATKPEG
jgi:hypothetical protein